MIPSKNELTLYNLARQGSMASQLIFEGELGGGNFVLLIL